MRTSDERALGGQGHRVARLSMSRPVCDISGLSVVARTVAISARIQSGPFQGCVPPKQPSPPAAETAAASVPPLCKAMGADITGWASPNISVNLVCNMAEQ